MTVRRGAGRIASAYAKFLTNKPAQRYSRYTVSIIGLIDRVCTDMRQ